MQLIRFADCDATPWKNGAGVTVELWQKRDAKGASVIRISIAEVKGDQAFSVFAGIDRVIMPLHGPDMVLNIDGVETTLKHHQSLAFAGEAIVTCRLSGSGAAQDLNLMCQRLAYRPAIKVLQLPQGEVVRVDTDSSVIAFLALQPCTISAPQILSLARYDLLLFDHSEVIEVSSDHGLFARLEAAPIML